MHDGLLEIRIKPVDRWKERPFSGKMLSLAVARCPLQSIDDDVQGLFVHPIMPFTVQGELVHYVADGTNHFPMTPVRDFDEFIAQ